MTNRQFFIERWEREYPAMLGVLRAVPADKLQFRPEARSAGELVSLLVYKTEIALELCDSGKINWNEPKVHGTLKEMIAAYERNHKALVEKLRQLDDARWDRKAPFLIMGQDVVGETMAGLLWMNLFDGVHHRGQLTAYLRPMGGKVPSIYGPSADDPGN